MFSVSLFIKSYHRHIVAMRANNLNSQFVVKDDSGRINRHHALQLNLNGKTLLQTAP